MQPNPTVTIKRHGNAGWFIFQQDGTLLCYRPFHTAADAVRWVVKQPTTYHVVLQYDNQSAPTQDEETA